MRGPTIDDGLALLLAWVFAKEPLQTAGASTLVRATFGGCVADA